MNPRSRRSLALLRSVGAPWVERERHCTRWLHGATAWPLVVRLLVAVSRLGDGPLWYGLIALLPWLGGASGSACALRLLVMGLGNLLLYKLLKRCFARA